MTAPWCDGRWRPGPLDEPALTIVVWGVPGVAGSKTAFPIFSGTGENRRWVRNIVAPDEQSRAKKNQTWRSAVLEAGVAAITMPDGLTIRPGFPLDEALIVDMVFTVPKPASAPKTRRTWPATRPDVLKYCRATEDTLTNAGVIKDDARITDYGRLSKVYPNEDTDALGIPGALIRLWRKTDVHGARLAPDGRPGTSSLAGLF